MKTSLLELRIEDLLLEHRTVTKKGIIEYVIKFLNGEEMPPIRASYCVHRGKYLVEDGHHRAFFARYLLNKSSIPAEVEPCYTGYCSGVETDCHEYNINHIILE